MSSMRAAICATCYVMCASVYMCVWVCGCGAGRVQRWDRHCCPTLWQEEGGLGGGSALVTEIL